jgi:hypothetical protein
MSPNSAAASMPSRSVASDHEASPLSVDRGLVAAWIAAESLVRVMAGRPARRSAGRRHVGTAMSSRHLGTRGPGAQPRELRRSSSVKLRRRSFPVFTRLTDSESEDIAAATA